MSASQEKIRRREEKNNGPDKKEVEKAKKVKEDKKRRKITISVIAIFVVLALFAVFFSSNALYRKFTAATINETELSVAEFNYYYYESYNQYRSMMGQMMESIPNGENLTAIETANQLKNRVMDEETGETYGEYFVSLANSLLRETMASYDAAMEAGYELPQSYIDEIDETISSIETMSSYYGYASLESYLGSVYGKGMNREMLRELLIRTKTSEQYKEHIRTSAEFSEEEILENYENRIDDYHTYNYRQFYIDGKGGLKDPTEETMAEALKVAEEFQAQITDEESFMDLCYEYAAEEEKEEYTHDHKTIRHYIGEGLVSYTRDWLCDSSRQEGDTYIAEAAKGYYVCYFLSRDENQYNTRDIQVITLAVATANEEDYDDPAELEAANQDYINAAEESTNEIYQQWLDEGATIEGFASISRTTSDNGGDGMNEYVYQNQFGEVVNDWLFSSAREEGDSDVLYDEEANTFYMVHYLGENEPYAYHESKEDLQNAKYSEWYEELMATYPEAEMTWFGKFVG